MPAHDPAPGRPEIARLVAPNPGPMTLEGTNTYVVGPLPSDRLPEGGAVYVIDPGPDDPGHLEAVRELAAERGTLAGALLTHSHADHAEGVEALGAELLWGHVAHSDETSWRPGAPAPDPCDFRPDSSASRDRGAGAPGSTAAPSAGGAGAQRSGESAEPDRGPRDRTRGRAAEGSGAGAPHRTVAPFEVIPTPGHAHDHVCFRLGEVVFCGDLVLGTGSSIVPPAWFGGSLALYMDSLQRIRDLAPRLLCPGHGPWIADPEARLGEYAEHRRERERRLVAALERGERSRERLLSEVWDDVPAQMRPAAAFAMQAHLEKLAEEDRLPPNLGD